MARRPGGALLIACLAACGGAGDGDGGSGAMGAAPRGGADRIDGPAYPGADIVLVSLDTLRADATTFGGGPQGLTDALDALAAESIVFTHARAQAPQTAPSHMSLFTSTLPSVHGVQNVQHGVDEETGLKRPLIQRAPDEIPTLAEVLSRAGYATVGLTDGGNLNPPHGFDRGFDRYTYQLQGAEAQVADGLQTLPGLRDGERPYFLFWHTYQIHAPYVAPPAYLARWAPDDYQGVMKARVEAVAELGFREAFGSMRSLYWADKEGFGAPEARYLRGVYEAGIDHADDVLVPWIEALRGLDDAIVVLTSDHGEEFFEHGQWQHDQVFEECLRVPLMIRLPGGRGAGRRIDTPVALVDLMPTLLDLVGVVRSAPDGGLLLPMHGRSLASHLLDGSEPKSVPIVSEYRADRKGGPLYDWQVAIQYEGRKFISDRYRQSIWWGEGKADKSWRDHYLFELASDPGEQRNLAPQGGTWVSRFDTLLSRHLAEVEAAADLQRLDAGGELDADALQQLIELGYLEGRKDG